MNKLKLAYLLLIASAILLIINIYNLDFKNLQNGNYWGIASNLLLMIGIIINIRDLKNREENKQKMEKDKILNFLNKYNYNYSEKNNSKQNIFSVKRRSTKEFCNYKETLLHQILEFFDFWIFCCTNEA